MHGKHHAVWRISTKISKFPYKRNDDDIRFEKILETMEKI